MVSVATLKHSGVDEFTKNPCNPFLQSPFQLNSPCWDIDTASLPMANLLLGAQLCCLLALAAYEGQA